MELMDWMDRWHMLPPPGGTILCAVSGGRDSMCLLHYLWTVAADRDFSVAAAHMNHGMRPTAGRDEELVRRFCAQRQIPLYVGYEKVYEKAEEWDLGVEETGRRLRYEFLERIADDIGAARIATAHHMGDQAETVLLHLLRGTGAEGLAGIPPVRGRLVRPLLHTTRQEIEAYLKGRGVTYVEDETNADLRYARNRLRLVIWPELERINPAAREHMARTAQILRRESEYLDTLAAQSLPPEGTALARQVLLEAPEVLRPRMLRLLIDRLGCGKKDFGQAHLTALERLAEGGGMLDLPGGARAVCRDGTLYLEAVPDGAPAETALQEGGGVIWGDYEIALARGRGDTAAGESLALRCDGVLSVRVWHRDDRLTLPGSRGPRSLKRLFAESGIDPDRRERIPVICVDGRAAAVCGIGVDAAYTAQSGGEAVTIICRKRE